MRVLGLAASPRRGGNTEILLDGFLAGAEAAGARVSKIAVTSLSIVSETMQVEERQNWTSCWQNDRCTATGDYRRVCEQMVAADVVALASPVYFRTVPFQLKALIDYTQCQWVRKYVHGKPLAPSSSGYDRRRGILLSVGGETGTDLQKHFGAAIRPVKAFLSLYEVDYWAELLYADVDPKGAILDHPTALSDAYDLGRRSVTEAWDEETD